MQESTKRQLIEDYIRAYNSFDVDGMMACLHHEISFENISQGVVTASANGAGEFRQIAEKGADIFQSRCQTIITLRIDDDSAVAEIDYRGVLAIDIPNGPSAGQEIRLQGRSAFTFREGKITRIVDEA